MTLVEELARFVSSSRWEDVSPPAREQLGLRVLDSLGCALGALGGEVPALVRAQVDDFGGEPHCALIGGGRSAPDRAALHNGALVRYLDFNDSHLAPGKTCHPSDNLAPVLAAAEYAHADGRTLLTALAVAYQVQCRLSEVAPVRAKGFDHTVQGAYGAAAGAARALGLDAERTAHAIASRRAARRPGPARAVRARADRRRRRAGPPAPRRGQARRRALGALPRRAPAPHVAPEPRAEIVDAVRRLDQNPVNALTRLLAGIGAGATTASS